MRLALSNSPTGQGRNQTQAPRCGPRASTRPLAKVGRSPSVVARSGRRWEDIEAVPAYVLPPVKSEELLAEEGRFVGEVIRVWLDEEWTPLEVHTRLGQATCEAYTNLRKQGEDEMGSILIGMSTSLMTFDFHDTFTSAFDVANKVSEVVMMRNGCDVCCVGEADKERFERVSTVPQRQELDV
eukprot:gene23555-9079_t